MASSSSAVKEFDHNFGERALRTLTEASSALLAGCDAVSAPRAILKFARELIAADGYAVWRHVDGDSRRRLLASQGLFSLSQETAFYISPQTSGLIVAEDVFAEPALAERAEWYRAEGIRSLLIVGLEVHEQLCGTIVFYYREPHAFLSEEIEYAKVLANLSASALYMTELQEAQQRERARLKFLAEASAMLASSLHYEETLNSIARLAVPHLADGCTVSMHEDGELVALAIAHADPEREKAVREFSQRFHYRIHDGSGSGTVLATGKSVLRPLVSDEYLAGTAQSEEHLAALRRLGLTSQILLPLKSRDRVIGVMRLFTDQSKRLLTEDDLCFAEDLAARASSAIENAELFRQLGLSESRYRSLIDATSSLAFTVDPAGNFVEPQPAWSAYCGQTWEEARGYGWANALHPDDRQRMVESVLWAVGELYPHVNRARLWHASSKTYRHCMVRAVPMKDDAGKVREWVGVIVDIHDQTLAEEKLRRTEQLATAGRLAATVAHEINNPLESITNLVYLAQQAPSLDATSRGYLDMAADEMQRVAQIVRQTLGFYRENSSPREADIGEIAAEVQQLYRRNLMAKGLKLVAEIEAGVKALVVPGEIRQVIANLVANSIDASEAGTRIEMTVRNFEGSVLIRVADQGSGISEESQSHLFEPFFTTKKDLGTGLGLWVSRGLIDKHHGTLTLETRTEEHDHGTIFTILLPPDGKAPIPNALFDRAELPRT